MHPLDERSRVSQQVKRRLSGVFKMTLYHDPTYFQTFKNADKPKRCRHPLISQLTFTGDPVMGIKQTYTDPKRFLKVLAYTPLWCEACGSFKYGLDGNYKWHSPKGIKK